jgi:serine/threonine protein kinase
MVKLLLFLLLLSQVGILQKMQPCRNVVRLRGCFESSEEVMVVTDMCKGGDLQKLSDVSVLWMVGPFLMYLAGQAVQCKVLESVAASLL